MFSSLKKPRFRLLHTLTQTPYTNVCGTDGADDMRASPKSPSYLVRNPYSYCFRMVVPKDLQKFVGRRELRYTLRTGYVGMMAMSGLSAMRGSTFLCRAMLQFQITIRSVMGSFRLSKPFRLTIPYQRSNCRESRIGGYSKCPINGGAK